MNPLRYFSSAAEKVLAHELVHQISTEIPPKMLDKGQKLVSVNKITQIIEKAYQAAALYQKEHRIGFIKRAILANSFQWGLKNAGYSDEFVEMATEGLVVALSKAQGKRAKPT